jgi:uncharacterized membrane protein
MSYKPIFVYAATYSSKDAAEADFDVLLALHADKLVGTYDVAVIDKDEKGKVHVHKHEKATQHGAWGGAAVGALVGVIFPPALLGAAAVGGVVGGLGAHFRKGLSRGDAKELGATLDEGEAALVLIGESKVREQLDKALTRADKSIQKQLGADSKDFEHDLEKAETELTMQEAAAAS